MTQRSKLVAGVLAVATILTGATLVWSNSSPGATPCDASSLHLSGSALVVSCGPTAASWVVGTSQPPSSSTSVAPTTTTVPATTTTAAPTTSTTVPGTPISCIDYDDPTNVFHVNGAPLGSSLVDDARPVISLAADGPLAQYTVKVNATVLPGTFKANAASVVCIQPTSPLPEGMNTISAVELAPGFGPIDPYSFTVDTVAPAPPTITSAAFSAGYVRVAGTGIPTSHISVREQGAAGTGGSTVGATGLWTCAYSRPSGTHVIYAVQRDAAGNESGPSNMVGVIVP